MSAEDRKAGKTRAWGLSELRQSRLAPSLSPSPGVTGWVGARPWGMRGCTGQAVHKEEPVGCRLDVLWRDEGQWPLKISGLDHALEEEVGDPPPTVVKHSNTTHPQRGAVG